MRSQIYSIKNIYWQHVPRGWEMMAYEKRAKIVCRYFYPEKSP